MCPQAGSVPLLVMSKAAAMPSQDLSAAVSFLKDLRSRVSPDDAIQVKNVSRGPLDCLLHLMQFKVFQPSDWLLLPRNASHFPLIECFVTISCSIHWFGVAAGQAPGGPLPANVGGSTGWHCRIHCYTAED